MLKRPRQDDLCAMASGVLLALSFPNGNLWFLAWFALVPWLLTLQQRPFRSGMLAGGVFFALVLYWVNLVMTRYGGLNLPLSLVAYLLLVAYLAVYFGAVSWVSTWLSRQLGLSLLVGFPLAWGAAEYARAHLLTGFPWASLGYSQQAFLPFIQTAEIWGVTGVSLLVVFGNLLLARVWRAFADSAGLVRCALPCCVLVLLLVGIGLYGQLRLQELATATSSNPLTVAVAQGNIEQGVKWNPEYLQKTLDRYASLTDQASQVPLDLIIWPESATPFFFQDPSPQAEFVRAVAARADAALLFGSPAYQRAGTSFEYFNSAFLLSPGGQLLGRSDKVHLVPFGEYVPLKWLLPFIDKLVVGIGDFSPGKLQTLPFGATRLGVLVCYEVIFPELARGYIRQGADLLVNITNDAWFGRSSAPYQHLAMASLRAVENRVWIARAANTGVSAFIDPTGRVHSATELFRSEFRIQQLNANASPGFYTRFGDLPGQTCLGLSLLLLAVACLRQKIRQRKS